MGRLENKTVIISGGAGAQGASEALLCAKEGAKVIFGDVLDRLGQDLECSIRAKGGEATYVHLDVSSQSDWDTVLETAENKYGSVDVLINNAGINLEESSEASWGEVLKMNLHGPYLGIQTVIPSMKKSGAGSIVNISSLAGFIGRKGSPYSFTASKGALRMLSKGVAVDHAKAKIRCNTIISGLSDSPGDFDVDRKLNDNRLSEIPLGRYVTTDDVSFAVLFLASDESSWMTGAEMVVDGGLTAQ